MERTSQWSRMTERPPATDLRGTSAPEASFNTLTANLVVAYAVDFKSDFFSGAAPVSVVSLVLPEDLGGVLSSLPGTDGVRSVSVSGSVAGSGLCGAIGLDLR